MLPVGVQTRIKRFPWVTASIILINIALFMPRYWMDFREYWLIIKPFFFAINASAVLLSVEFHPF